MTKRYASFLPSHWLGMALLLLILGSCGKADFRKAQVDEFSLTSGFTGRNYLIRVLLPPDYAPDQSYPMITLLDGYFHFKELGEASSE